MHQDEVAGMLFRPNFIDVRAIQLVAAHSSVSYMMLRVLLPMDLAGSGISSIGRTRPQGVPDEDLFGARPFRHHQVAQ